MSKEAFIHIEGWMTKLGFPAPKMIIYAIVYALCHNDPDPNPKGAYCSMAYFSKYSMVSKTTVRKYIKELIEEKYFARKVEFIYDGKMQKNYLWANTPEDKGKEIKGFSYEWEAFGDDTERLVKIQESWGKRKQEKKALIEKEGYSNNLRGYSNNLRGGTQVSGGGTQVSLGHNNIKITSSSITKGKHIVSKETKQMPIDTRNGNDSPNEQNAQKPAQLTFPLEDADQTSNQNQVQSSNIQPQNYEPNPPNSVVPPSHKKVNEKELWEQEFEELWKLYPRKESKTNGLKAYLKARKKGVSKETILEALKRYKQKVESEHTKRKYIIKGGNWFNGERWEDEIDNNEERQKGESSTPLDLLDLIN